MKTSKTTISKTTISKSKYFLLALLVAFNFSCSTEDGEDGAPGPAGPAGTDGNANVTVKTIIPDPGPYLDWTLGSYLFGEANVFEINDMDITQEVTDNSLILVHFQLFQQDKWYPMTYALPIDANSNEIITYTYELNLLTIYARETSGTLASAISKLKYFIIDSSNSRMKATDYTKMSHDELMEYFDL